MTCGHHSPADDEGASGLRAALRRAIDAPDLDAHHDGSRACLAVETRGTALLAPRSLRALASRRP